MLFILIRCCCCTLRKYSPVGRFIKKMYQRIDTSIHLKKRLDVAISSLRLQNDLKYFSNPEKFDLACFSGENKNSDLLSRGFRSVKDPRCALVRCIK
jgi:hypothetical protein